MNRNLVWIIIAVAAAIAGLAYWMVSRTPVEVLIEQISGTITYREKITLPPGSTAEITLADISIADAPAKVLSTLILDDPGQVPITFSLDYDPTVIDERFRYAIQAHITIDGQLAFVNDTVHPVITQGNSNEVHIVLVMVQRASNFPADAESAAREIDSVRDDFVQMDGTLLTGEASITYSAYRNRADADTNSNIVLIEETREMGVYGNAVVSIYYSGGRPFRYTETGQRRRESQEGQPGLYDVTVTFEFDEEGNVTSRAKTLNGVASEPDDSEITGAYDHARFLMEESRLLTEANSASQIARFRCQGNEPFWNATINGNSMTLRELGSAEKMFLGQHTPLPDYEGDRFEWESNTRTHDKPDILVIITRQECQDTMSDEIFPLSGTVREADGRKNLGCCRSITP